MKFLIDHLLADRALTEAFGWAILHSLWQGAGVALLLAACLGVLRHQSANLRYYVSLVALVTMFGLFVGSFIYAYQPNQYAAGQALDQSPDSLAQLLLHGLWSEAARPLTWEGCQSWPDYYHWAMQTFGQSIDWVVTLWFVGVGLFLLRFLSGLAYTYRLRQVGTVPIGPEWEARLLAVKTRLGMTRAVKMFESALVAVPTVAGWLRPVILFPVGMLTALPPHELESILAHELAHIKRNDYLINLLQSLVEVVLFYHPATWWISARIDEERENCCDDLAVATVGDAITYIRALAGLAELRTRTQAPALAVTGRSGQLLQRIKRIAKKSEPKNWMSLQNFPARLVAVLLVCSVWMLSAAQTGATELAQVIGNNAVELATKVEKKISHLMVTNGDTVLPKKESVKESAKSGSKVVIERTINGETTVDTILTGDELKDLGANDTLNKTEWKWITREGIELQNFKFKYFVPGPRGLSLADSVVTSKFKQYAPVPLGPPVPDSAFTSKWESNLPLHFQPGDSFPGQQEFLFFSNKSPQGPATFWGSAPSATSGERQKALQELQEKMQELKKAKGKDRARQMQEMEQKIEELQKLGSVRQFKGIADPGTVITERVLLGPANRPNHFLGSPLYVIDGEQVVGRAPLAALNPDHIATIDVLKGESATAIYGDAAKEGVVVVITKNGAKVNAQPRAKVSTVTTTVTDKRIVIVNQGNIAITKGGDSQPGKMLYVIDGQIVDGKVVEQLKADNILSVTVLKGNSATAKYGDKAAEGVVEIITKPENSPAAARVEEVLVDNLQVYPNPTGNGQINIQVELKAATAVSLQVTDTHGVTVANILSSRELAAGKHAFQWITKNQAAGVYFVNLTQNGQVSTKRVVVE